MARGHHEHDDPHAPSLRETELRVRALESLLVEKGLVDPGAFDELIDTYERASTTRPAKITQHGRAQQHRRAEGQQRRLKATGLGLQHEVPGGVEHRRTQYECEGERWQRGRLLYGRRFNDE
jgi:hypothetical protein